MDVVRCRTVAQDSIFCEAEKEVEDEHKDEECESCAVESDSFV